MVQDDNGNAPHPRRELLERPLYELAGKDRRRVVRHLLAGCQACGRIALLSWGLPGMVTGRVEAPGWKRLHRPSRVRRERERV